jgi:hypothetical protein
MSSTLPSIALEFLKTGNPVADDGPLNRYGVHASLADAQSPVRMGKATVLRGALGISRGSSPPRQLLYELRAGELRPDVCVLLLIVDACSGRMLSVGFEDPRPFLRLGQDSLTSVELGFGWDAETVMVDGELMSPGEAMASNRLRGALEGSDAELFAALDIVTLSTLFGADEDSALSLHWPEGPRRSFHRFATILAACWGVGER